MMSDLFENDRLATLQDSLPSDTLEQFNELLDTYQEEEVGFHFKQDVCCFLKDGTPDPACVSDVIDDRNQIADFYEMHLLNGGDSNE